MRYVLDSSVALKVSLPEPDSAKAIQLRDDFRNGIHELICLYVALGEQEQCEVVSADQRLVNTFPGRVIPLASL
jgi:predicted nucleic acid-binding protein